MYYAILVPPTILGLFSKRKLSRLDRQIKETFPVLEQRNLHLGTGKFCLVNRSYTALTGQLTVILADGALSPSHIFLLLHVNFAV
jgi:hypothetical protein